VAAGGVHGPVRLGEEPGGGRCGSSHGHADARPDLHRCFRQRVGGGDRRREPVAERDRAGVVGHPERDDELVAADPGDQSPASTTLAKRRATMTQLAAQVVTQAVVHLFEVVFVVGRKTALAGEDESAAELTLVRSLNMRVTHGPRGGFHSVTPRMVVTDVDAQVQFLREVFDATGDVVGDRPAEILIGDSLIMVTPDIERELFPAFLYIYVDDADIAYDRALAAGAITLEAPLDTPYGDRRAMVRDPFGNVFQIAHQIPRP
jgi:PhnB protein